MLNQSEWRLFRAKLLTIRMAAAGLLVGLVASLAALPTVPAGASPVRGDGILTPVSVSTFGSGEVEAVLSGLPLEDISAAELGDVLAQLPGLKTLPSTALQQSLTTAIEELAAKGDTLGQLNNPTELIGDLGTQLGKVLSLGELLSLLKGGTLSSLLTSALKSLPSGELLGGLLGSSAHPEQLIEHLLGSLDPSTLQGLLGSTLGGEPFTHTTVSELATKLGTTTEGLVGDLGTTIAQLPSTAMALTAPLTNGKLLSVLDGLGGVSLALLTPPHEEGSKGSGSSGGGGSGGSGGAGGSGSPGSGSTGSSGSSSGAPGSTTVVVNSIATPPVAATASSGSFSRPSVKVISRHVRGHRVTLVLQVSGPGALTVTGKGVRKISTQAARAERLTVHTALTRAGAASVRRHGRALKVTLRVSFRSVGGPSAAASTAVVFR
jgi:uncharacterized membrane protein YgcG